MGDIPKDVSLTDVQLKGCEVGIEYRGKPHNFFMAWTNFNFVTLGLEFLGGPLPLEKFLHMK